MVCVPFPYMQRLKPEYWNYLEKPKVHEFCVGHYFIDIDVDIVGVLCGAHVVKTTAAPVAASGNQPGHRLMERPDDCSLGCAGCGGAGIGGYRCHARVVEMAQSGVEAKTGLNVVQVNCVLIFCAFLPVLQRE